MIDNLGRVPRTGTESTSDMTRLNRERYDALLSHLSAFTRVTLATAPEVTDPFRSIRPGEPILTTTICKGISTLLSMRIISGYEEEAKRIKNAIAALFGFFIVTDTTDIIP